MFLAAMSDVVMELELESPGFPEMLFSASLTSWVILCMAANTTK